MAESSVGASTDAAAGEGPGPAGSRATGTPGQIVPAWLVNLAAVGWRVLVVAGLAVVLWLLASVLWTVTAAIGVAVVVSAAFAPIVLGLRQRGRSETAAAAIVWAAAITGIMAVLILLGIAFFPYVAEVLARFEAGIAEAQADLAGAAAPAVVAAAGDLLRGLARAALSEMAGSVVESAAGVVTVLVLASFLVFFFLRDGDNAWGWAFQGFTEEKRARMTSAGRDAMLRVGGYLRGTTLLSAIIALTDLIFLLVLGVPLAVPLSVLVFLGGYIPYFGGIVTTLLVLGITLSAVGPTAALVMLGLIAVRNVFLGYIVRPAVYGRSVSLHPALVLVVLPAGFQLAGIVGLFVAVPVTAALFAVARAVLELVDPDPHPVLPGLVPAWLDRVAQWSWRILVGTAILALVVGVLVTIPLVVLPVVLAVILAATLEPLVRVLVGRGRQRPAAAAIVVGGGFLVITALLALTFATLVSQMTDIGSAAASGADAADLALGGLAGLLAGAVTDLGRGTMQTVGAVAEKAAQTGVILVPGALLAFYFLRDGMRLAERLVARARPGVAADVRGASTRAVEVLGGYMGGTAAISFVGAGSQLVIMVLLGLPLALPVFVLSFFLGFIPYVGGFISTGLAFLISIQFGSTSDIVVMGVWTLVFNIVTGNIVGPLVYQRTVHIHPAVVLVAIPAAGAIAGVVGMFLVVPAIGVVAATWRTVIAVMNADGDPGPSIAPPGTSAG
jgi:predicted PurR-regulated permease PerM